MNDQVRRDFEKAEKDISKVVPGIKFGELLSLWGAYHRFVVVNVDEPPYKAEPGQRLPAFGFVTTMRDPQFGKSVEGLVRGAGFLLSLQYGLKLVEETTDGVKVVGYRFPEDKPLPGDDANLRYNFEPAFAVVGDQFVTASTVELAKKLVAEVKRTAGQPGSPLTWRATGYAAGGAAALAGRPGRGGERDGAAAGRRPRRGSPPGGRTGRLPAHPRHHQPRLGPGDEGIQARRGLEAGAKQELTACDSLKNPTPRPPPRSGEGEEEGNPTRSALRPPSPSRGGAGGGVGFQSASSRCFGHAYSILRVGP